MRYYITVCMVIVSVLAVDASKDSTVAVSKGLVDRVEQLLNKTGVLFSGEMNSAYFSSKLSGDGENPMGRQRETDEYSSIDLNIGFRPNTAIEGKLILRVHHNWENFWSDPGNPIFSRWISIDGNIAQHIKLHISDFTAKLTPLTLYMPEIDIVNEPEIFRRRRQKAMSEYFLQDNRRPLQGVTAGFGSNFKAAIDSFQLNVYGCRLRSVETDIENGSRVVTRIEEALYFSKYFAGVNFDVGILNNLLFGGTFMIIADHSLSLKSSDRVDVPCAQQTKIADFRGEYDVASITGRMMDTLKAYGEAAFSFDGNTCYSRYGSVNDKMMGSAAYGGVAASVNILSNCKIGTDLRYLRNKKHYRNELAQSPSFIGSRIMNVEADSFNNETFVPNHYSTFDALYHRVFKFCPSKETNLWHKAPFTKNAYTNNVYTSDEMHQLEDSLLDPAVQLIMPFGPSTPDRQGGEITITMVEERIGVDVYLHYMSLTEERRPMLSMARDMQKRYRKGEAGVNWNAAKILPRLSYPLVLSGSFMRSSIDESHRSIVNNHVTAGLFWQCIKYVSFSGGVQNIVTKYNKEADLKQMYLLGGVSLLLSSRARVNCTVGKIIVDNTKIKTMSEKELTLVHQNTNGQFSQVLFEVSIDVDF